MAARRQPLVQLMQLPRRAAPRRARRSKKKGRSLRSRFNPDLLFRGTAMFSSASKLLHAPVAAVVNRREQGGGAMFEEAVSSMAAVPWTAYFTAQGPLIAAEGGIQARRAVARITRSIGRAVGL